MKWISVADRAHALLSRGFNAVEDRLEPEARQAVGRALYTYGKRRRQLANVDRNVREIRANLQRAFPVYPGSEEKMHFAFLLSDSVFVK